MGSANSRQYVSTKQINVHVSRLDSKCHTYTMCPAGMALNSRHKGTNAPSFRSAVVDEERLGPGYWLRSVLNLARKKLCHLSQKIFLQKK